MTTETMNPVAVLEDLMITRRSVRGFLDKPVPEDILRKVFEIAQLAPSNCNIQPWRVYVASGAARDRIRDEMVQRVSKGHPPAFDFAYPGKFEDPYRKHQVECAVALYTEMGIGREDKMGRLKGIVRNFELFDAPHVAFIGMDKTFPQTVALDVGIYLQTLMLAMTAHGIQSCAQGSMRTYPDIVRREFGMPDNVGILVGISFGYENPEVPANRTRTTRAPLGENVKFISE